MLHNLCWYSSIGQYTQKNSIGNKVKSWKNTTFSLQIFVERFFTLLQLFMHIMQGFFPSISGATGNNSRFRWNIPH